MSGTTNQNSSVQSSTDATSSGTEIKPENPGTSDVAEQSNVTSSADTAASHTIVGATDGEQHISEDDPTTPLITPRYRDDAPPIRIVDYRTYEPPPPPRPSCIQCMCCCFITTYNIHYARKVRNSKYMVPLLLALLVIPMSALYFGVGYIGSCNLAQFSPLLVIIMGIVGIIFIVVRLMTLSIRLWNLRLWNMEEPPQIVFVSLTIVLMILMPMEMVHFYTKTPVFDDNKDPLYCEKPFYYYVFYMNFVVISIGILALLLHIPMKPQDPVQVVPREYFDAL